MENNGDRSWFEALKSKATEKRYTAGESIHFQGEIPSSIGVIGSGKAEAIYFSENGDEVWLGQFIEGDFIGHVSLLSDAQSNYDLLAKTDTVAYLMPPRQFRQLLETNDPLRDALSKDFAKRLNFMSISLADAYALSAKGRICSELVRLSFEIGIDPGKYIIRPNPVCVELARRVNSTRETVSRTISELQKMGIVTRQPGALIVQNPEKLRRAFQ